MKEIEEWVCVWWGGGGLEINKHTRDTKSGPRNWGGAHGEGFGRGVSQRARNGRISIIPQGRSLQHKGMVMEIVLYSRKGRLDGWIMGNMANYQNIKIFGDTWWLNYMFQFHIDTEHPGSGQGMLSHACCMGSRRTVGKSILSHSLPPTPAKPGLFLQGSSELILVSHS